jgi:hypothetical protein
MVAHGDVTVTHSEKRDDCHVTDVCSPPPSLEIPVVTEFFDWHQLVTPGSHRPAISTCRWPAFS